MCFNDTPSTEIYPLPLHDTRPIPRAALCRTAERPAAGPSGPESADVVDLTSSPDEDSVMRSTALPSVNRRVVTHPKLGYATQRTQAKAVHTVTVKPSAVWDIVASMCPKGSDDKPGSAGSGPSDAQPIRKAEPMEEGAGRNRSSCRRCCRSVGSAHSSEPFGGNRSWEV